MKGRKVLVFSRDPGGTNAVLQLIGPLRALENEVLVYGKDAALPIYGRAKVECANIREEIPSGTQNETEAFVRRLRPDLILTGTSSEDFTERQLWQATETAHIASFAVLDQWTNYRLRLIPEGEDVMNGPANGQKLITPSVLFIMDELAKTEIAALGIERSRLVVTGQPFFDHIRETAKRFASEEISQLHQQITRGRAGPLIVFASQPITSIHRQNGMAEDHWGYTEKTVLASVMASLGRLVSELSTEVTFLIRLHPKDELHAYDEALSTCPQSVDVIFDREINSTLLLKAANVIIGMFSMILLEAAILERPFISVQIGLKRENPLVLDRLGLTKTILTERQLEEALRMVLVGQMPPRPAVPFKFGATERIVEYLESYR